VGNGDKISGLTDEAETRDYLMKLPARMARISERIVIPQNAYFKWVEPARL
jgi:acyl-[acyl-carrier-protein] desaturase